MCLAFIFSSLGLEHHGCLKPSKHSPYIVHKFSPRSHKYSCNKKGFLPELQTVEFTHLRLCHLLLQFSAVRLLQNWLSGSWIFGVSQFQNGFDSRLKIKFHFMTGIIIPNIYIYIIWKVIKVMFQTTNQMIFSWLQPRLPQPDWPLLVPLRHFWL